MKWFEAKSLSLIRYCSALVILLTGCCYLAPAQVPEAVLKVYKPGGPRFYLASLFKASQRNQVPYPHALVLLDSAGHPIFCQKIKLKPWEFSCDFKLLPDGRLSYFLRDKFYIMDPAFRVVDSIFPPKYRFDNHDLQLTPQGHYLILAKEDVVMDLSRFKMFNKKAEPGSPTATVSCGVILELDRDKNVVFEWHAKDHFQFDDVDSSYLSNPLNVGWTHFNSLEADQDGNILVSIRNFNEICKINRATGQVMWRLGGKRNQFRLPDTTLFWAQHDCRRLANGHLTVFDNGRPHPFRPASALELRLDEKDRVAEKVSSFVPDSGAQSFTGLGNVQDCGKGRRLVNVGISSHPGQFVTVVDSAMQRLLDLSFKDSLLSYRVYAYDSLPFAIERPRVNLSRGQAGVTLKASGGRSFVWSNGQSGVSLVLRRRGSYFVSIPAGRGRLYSPLLKVDKL